MKFFKFDRYFLSKKFNKIEKVKDNQERRQKLTKIAKKLGQEIRAFTS